MTPQHGCLLFSFPFVAMISLSGRVHLSFPPAAVEGRGGLQGGRFEASHRLEGGGRSGLDKVEGGGCGSMVRG